MKSLQEAFNSIFTSLGGSLDQCQMVPSQVPHLADFQVNGALSLAKKLNKNPRDLAQEVVNKINTSDATLSIAGPGFINIKLTDLSLINQIGINPSTEKEQKVIIDFSSPNVAKGMHVGHLRSTLIGAALVNLYRFCGYSTAGDNHLGDWGTPMGIVISKILESENFQWTLENIEQLYIQGSIQYKDDLDFKSKVKEITNNLQQGDQKVKEIWEKLVSTTISSLKEDYDQLGIKFDLWQGESFFEAMLPSMINELKIKGVATESLGAVVMPLSNPNDPPLLLEKSGGGFLYHTTDLACVKYRSNLYSKILYVVDKRQSLHFKQVFEAANIAGYNSSGCEHVKFGTINGPDGTPFKTRSGGVLKLKDLISQFKVKALEKIEELNPDLTSIEKESISNIVAIGSLKFSELKHHRESDYIFDIDKFMALEGFTGPYVMYSTVRAKSILSKTLETGKSSTEGITPEVRKLMVKLMEVNHSIEKSLKLNQPHILCEYSFDLCKLFSSFYASSNILKEENESIRKNYLWLVEEFYKTNSIVLNLLGIKIPDKM